MKDNPLELLSIETQKDEIIARLVLQKASLYVQFTERWLDGFLSQKEMQHVVQYGIDSDKEAFKDIIEEIQNYLTD